MTPSYIALDFTDLLMASLFVLLAAKLSFILELGISRRIVIAGARTTVQLLLIGMVLKMLFEAANLWWTLLAATVMIAMAGYEATARQERRLTGLWAYGIGTSAMMMAAAVVTAFALTVVVRPDPWFAPQYAVPLLGMILGNTMNGIALGLNTLTTQARSERAAIEARLSLGASRMTAINHVLKRAMRTALTPIVNAMSAAGIISLPGMMTGQILAGADPVEATKYQVLIMFLIAGGTTLGAITAVLFGALRLTDKRHRLRLDRLAAPKGM